ncbi:MAG: hypothetical protein AB8E15_06125 [Bdellovibrionales bacterium]
MSNDPSNRAGYQALIWSMVATILFMGYIAFLHPGVVLDPVPEAQKEQAQ